MEEYDQSDTSLGLDELPARHDLFFLPDDVNPGTFQDKYLQYRFARGVRSAFILGVMHIVTKIFASIAPRCLNGLEWAPLWIKWTTRCVYGVVWTLGGIELCYSVDLTVRHMRHMRRICIVYNSDDNDDDDYTKVFATSANCHIEDPDDDILSICDIDIEPIAGSIYERAPLQRQLVDLLSLECRRGFEYNSDDERTAAELHNEFIAKEKSDDLSLDDWVYCDIYGSDNDAEVAELRHLADAAREEEMLLQTSNTMGVPLSVDTELETEMGVDIGWGRKLLKLLGAKEKKWRVTASMYHV